ncbi:hypothetical protein D3C74_49830 [compost metagenome]
MGKNEGLDNIFVLHPNVTPSVQRAVLYAYAQETNDETLKAGIMRCLNGETTGEPVEDIPVQRYSRTQLEMRIQELDKDAGLLYNLLNNKLYCHIDEHDPEGFESAGEASDDLIKEFDRIQASRLNSLDILYKARNELNAKIAELTIDVKEG